jgi:hypothetical protein
MGFEAHNPTPDSSRRGFRAIIRMQLTQDAFHVVLHGVFGDREPESDLLVAQALHDEI